MHDIGTKVLRMVLAVALGACASASGRAATESAQRMLEVRAELARLYEENAAAFDRADLAAVMRLRAPDFHSLAPDGRRNDRLAMEQYIQGFMNGVQKWNAQTVTIDSLRVVGDTAFAIVTQHLDRMALRADKQVHHVETWVTQRETWVRYGGTWLLWRVDQLRDQRRVIDGRPG